jgi:L-2-hydroxyglutarate oxidase LhgO
MTEQVDCVVIGAGVVGLAVARALALQGREVLVLEAAHAIGTETSSRNSEVIHAGLYYPTGSLKASLCVQGKHLLYDYCAARGIAHQRCGKLVVATDTAQHAQLHALAERANGVHDLVQLTANAAIQLEPQLHCTSALLSPSTGIIDSHALMLALQGDLEHAGGLLVFKSRLESARFFKDNIYLVVSGGIDNAAIELNAKLVINCAGLHAPALAQRFVGVDISRLPRAYFARGSYFSLAGRAPFSRLIYPVPHEASAAGLGVHLTLDLAGQARFGPDVEWIDSIDYSLDPARAEAFYAQVRSYWPGLADGALQSAYTGIRPKISGPGEPARDFMLQGWAGADGHGMPGLINLFGIESPGLTACLAIGDYVAQMARAQ